MAWTHKTLTTFSTEKSPSDDNLALRNYVLTRSIPLEEQGVMSAAILTLENGKFAVTRQFQNLESAAEWKTFMDQTYSAGEYSQAYTCTVDTI